MRGFPRAFLAVLLFLGQTALLAHHHARASRQEMRASLSRAGSVSDDAGCRLCELSYRSFAAHAPSQRLVAAPDAVCGRIDAGPSLVARRSPLDPACRAPPDA